MVSVLGLVFKVRRRREERALSFASTVHQRDAFLLSIEGGAVIPGQGQVGGDAFPKAVAEKGLIHTEWVLSPLRVILPSASGQKVDRERGKREGHSGMEDKRMRKGRKTNEEPG